MRTGKIKAHGLKVLARMEKKAPNTIINNPQLYIPIMIYSYQSRRTNEGSSTYYIRAKDIDHMYDMVGPAHRGVGRRWKKF